MMQLGMLLLEIQYYLLIDLFKRQFNMGHIQSLNVKSNGYFSIIKEPYDKKQHPNQQGGLDVYVDILDHQTGCINSVKLYENSKGLHFKKHGTWYLTEFVLDYLYVPYQIMEKTNE